MIAATAFIDATIANGDHIGLSAISLAEMVYLIEKGREEPVYSDGPACILPPTRPPAQCAAGEIVIHAIAKPFGAATGVNQINQIVWRPTKRVRMNPDMAD